MPETAKTSTDTQEKDSATNHVNVGQAERISSALLGGLMLFKGITGSRSPLRVSALALGGALLYRGLSGHCPVYGAMHVNTRTIDEEGVLVHAAATINRSPEELYRYWRQLENLPRIMSHLESVTEIDQKYSHWVARAPGGMTVEWKAEIVSETENREILWRSTEGAQITNAGSVRFVEAPGDRGTEVHVMLSYHPPAGSVGVAVAKLFGEEPQHQIEDDLRRFKQFMEAGEIATTQGQPSGRSLKRQIKAKFLASAESRQEPADSHSDSERLTERGEEGLREPVFDRMEKGVAR
jgi:uncharacterized membrane protein